MILFWQFFAGIGVFIYAMKLLEDSIRNLAGRSFKLFLRKQTSNTTKAIASSALVTGVLQSSSVVILMTLSFIGAGIMTMRNALAIAIGSNFGTTLDSWLVATLGFKLDIALFALPMIAVGSILHLFLSENKKPFQIARFLMGFGFLFLGLNFMKESIEVLLKDFDFTQYSNWSSGIFVLFGIVVTALIQSSSAVVAIVLSALHTGTIPFETGVAVVIGAELGNSVKILIGGFGGMPAKWQLAVGNVIFNFTITVLAYVFMQPLISFTVLIFGEGEILLRLVLLQSTMNFIGVLLFAPFINQLARFLEKYVRGKVEKSAFMITPQSMDNPAESLHALEKDTEILLYRVLPLNMEAFAAQKHFLKMPADVDIAISARNKKLKSYDEKYNDLKHAEGELLEYALNASVRQPEHKARMSELILCIRHAMHSAKAMKDVMHNRIDFRDSADDVIYKQYQDFKTQLQEYYQSLNNALENPQGESPGIRFHSLQRLAHDQYFSRQEEIYDAALHSSIPKEDISSLLNVNRELYTSSKTIVQALHLFFRQPGDTIKIGEMP